MGIATYPDDGQDADTLIKNADAAMFRAKGCGRNNYQFYTAAMNKQALENLLLESELRRALERREFVLHFQPKISFANGRITGCEALLRWQPADREMVAPSQFVPVLESSGMIVAVGEWVIDTACAQIVAWRKAGVAAVPIAVNLSAAQFHHHDICAVVTRALSEYAIEPQLLELEITESAAMQNAEDTAVMLRKLKALGVRIVIDDFGTGYSSLSYLKRFSIDTLKLDRSFVVNLPHDPDNAAISRAVITMAHSLNMKVVAEGVETDAQLAFLASYSCDEMQGYHFSQALTASDCTQLLRQQNEPQAPHRTGLDLRKTA